MGTTQTQQPGGYATFTGNGTVLLGPACFFTYQSATATCTWSLQAKPGSSNAAIVAKGINASLSMDLAGSYTVRFTDSGAVNTDVVLTCVAPSTSIPNLASGGAIGVAAATVDVFSFADVNQTTAAQTLTIPNPTDTANGREFKVNNVGSTSFTMLGATVAAGGSLLARWTGAAWSKFS